MHAESASFDGIFEIEITDLRPAPRLATWIGHSLAPPSPLARRVPRRQRWGRLMALTLLVLLALPTLAPTWGDRVVGLLASSPATVFALAGRNAQLGSAGQLSLAPDSQWTLLTRRALHLPFLAPGAACPVEPGRVVAAGLSPTLGNGPAYAMGVGSANGALIVNSATSLNAHGHDWGGQLVVWYLDPRYQGPVLIRGGQLSGTAQLRFNGGLDQQKYIYNLPIAPLMPALRLMADNTPGQQWIGWPSYTRLRVPGCYAYQVDGMNFSEIIVFQAVLAP
jgi:hypothetical protein